MSGELELLDKAEALKLTAAIKSWAGTLWLKLEEAHRRQAWRALGYPTWADYLSSEFDISRSRGYQLIAHADAVLELTSAAGLSTMVDTSENESRNAPPSPMGDIGERQTRDIDTRAAAADISERVAQLPPDATDDDRAEVVAETVAEHQPPKPEPAAPVEPAPTVSPEHAPTFDEEPEPSPSATRPPGKILPSDVPLRDPTLVLRANASKAVVAQHKLLRLDPAEVADVLLPEDRARYLAVAEQMRSWADGLTEALSSTHLRRVK